MSLLFFQYFMLNSHTLDTIEERKGDHFMDYKIKGDSDCPIVEINLQNNETIKNAVVSYVEPYASSTCEMVAEIFTVYRR